MGVDRTMAWNPGGGLAVAKSGGTTHLAALFDTYSLRLYRLARRLVGDADTARDMVQEVFLRAARHPGRLPGDDAGGEAWLVRAMVNLCRDRWRREKIRQRPMEPLPQAAATPDPEAAAVARATIGAALAVLSPRRRAVIVLHHLEERDTAEIAALLGIRQVTVRWHLAGARKQLAQLLLTTTGRPS
ncbi:MAG: sigma-70 family RNA polymerase sigma factor [Acidobacteria bacterium]|nr:MAG: sigma-70 family RNA polymerase sigma factor [Acidobacteriota bacterium]